MRRKFENILGEEFRYLAIQTRERLKLTQRQMGELLQMSENSYCYIETGHSSCGVLTAVLLLSMQEDPKEFLDHLTAKFAEKYEEEMQLT